jgi:hypothetical protein
MKEEKIEKKREKRRKRGSKYGMDCMEVVEQKIKEEKTKKKRYLFGRNGKEKIWY